MKFHSFALAALCTAIVVEASNPHEARLNARHNRLSRRTSNNKLAKRCKNRPQGPVGCLFLVGYFYLCF